MLSCYQCKIDCFIYKMFYVSFRITTKQKPTVDTQRIKRREPRHTSMERHEFTEAGKKDRRKEHGNHKKSGQQQGGIIQHFVVVQSLSRVCASELLCYCCCIWLYSIHSPNFQTAISNFSSLRTSNLFPSTLALG